MTQPIDVVYVDLEARGEEDAAADIKRAIRKLQRDVDKIAKDIEKSFTDVGRDMSTSMKVGADTAGAAIGDLADDATRDLKRIDHEARNVGKSISKSIGGGAGGAGLVDTLSQMGAHLRNISALAPPPIFLAIAAAIPAALALGGAVADLSALMLLLPAGIAAGISSVVALKLAFSGVGDAVKALASGDLDKIKEAMKGLAPSARAFAREINALRKPLQSLKKAVQESFFKPLRGDITQLTKTALPVLKSGLRGISGAFGDLGSDILKLLGSTKVLDSLKTIFKSTADIITNLSPSITGLLGSLFGVAEKGMPFLERGFAALGRGMEALSGFLDDITASGDFNTFLEDAFQIMSDLGGLTKSVFDLLGSIFGDLGDEGSGFIQMLSEMIDAMTRFFDSAEGQAVLQRLADILPFLVQGLATGLTVLAALAVLTEMTFRTLEAVGEIIVVVAKAIGTFFGNIPGWIASAWGAVTGFFGMLGGFFASIGGWIASAWGSIVGFFSGLIGWVTRLPGMLLAAIQAIPGIFRSVFTAVFDFLTTGVGFAIGAVVNYFIQLPGRIRAAITGLIGIVIAVFMAVRERAISVAIATVNGVVNFFRLLPSRVSAAIRAIISFVGSVFSSARSRATSTTSSLVNGVVNLFRTLPGRVGAAVSSMVSRVRSILSGMVSSAFGIGRSIISGIISGIGSAIGGAVAAARRAAANIVSGFKSALKVGSPSKVFADEVGRQIPAGIEVGIRAGESNLLQTINTMTRDVTPTATQSSVTGAISGGSGAEPSTGSVGGLDGGAIEVRVFIGDKELKDLVRVEVLDHNRDIKRRVTAGAGAK